jgi:hypothetical protein
MKPLININEIEDNLCGNIQRICLSKDGEKSFPLDKEKEPNQTLTPNQTLPVIQTPKLKSKMLNKRKESEDTIIFLFKNKKYKTL